MTAAAAPDLPEPPPLDDFHPPYRLGAFGSAIVGLWSAPPVLGAGALVAGASPFEPLRWRGECLGAAFVLRYDRPPADYPVAYDEIILSYVGRRGLRFAALPFDLVLDNSFYVAAGLQHYHLPKRFDPTLRVEIERDAARGPRRLTASGTDVTFDAALRSVRLPFAKGLVSALLRGFTTFVPVVGASSQPPLATQIRVSPDSATMSLARGARLEAGGRTLRPLASFFWETLAITIGAPGPVAP